MRKLYSKLTTNTLEQRQWRRTRIFITNFEQTSDIVQVFLLFTLKK